MSNYFPNARPNQNITATLRAVNDDPIVVCTAKLPVGILANLKEYIIEDYIDDPSNYPVYESKEQLTTTLDKVNMVLVVGTVQFPNVSSAQIDAPSGGLFVYGNSNFEGLSIKGSAILYIK